MTNKNQYIPDYAVPPGETLRELLEEREMSQAELAQRMGRTPKMINELMAGKAPLTHETALLLEQVLGVPARLWNRLEANYQEDLARLARRQELAAHVSWLKEFPLKAMLKNQWIAQHEDAIDQLIELLRFFSVASPEKWNSLWFAPQAAFRQSPAFEANPMAVAAWVRKGEIEAQKRECGPYDKEAFSCVLVELRDLTREPPAVFQQQIIERCAEVGVAVVFVPALPQSRVSGATQWLSPQKAQLQLSLRYKTSDHLWFTFYHEAGHIYLHGKRQVFIDDSDGSTCQKEAEADRFAADLLIPLAQWHSFITRPRKHYSKEEIVAFANELGIEPGIVVGRLQHEKLLKPTHCNVLKRYLEWQTQGDSVTITEKER